MSDFFSESLLWKTTLFRVLINRLHCAMPVTSSSPHRDVEMCVFGTVDMRWIRYRMLRYLVTTLDRTSLESSRTHVRLKLANLRHVFLKCLNDYGTHIPVILHRLMRIKQFVFILHLTLILIIWHDYLQ